MSRDYYTPPTPFLYTGAEGTQPLLPWGSENHSPSLQVSSLPTLQSKAPDSGSGGSGGLGPGSAGMDCLQPLRCPPTTPGPFHYLISEQAKSLVALQELQHEVGALLDFRDLVIETFPNLRTKMAVSSSPVTMTSSQVSNIPIPRRDWEPGVRVRRRIQHKESDNSPSRSRSNSHSGKAQPKSNTEATSVVQDSGFSTETSSSKETHSASSTNGAIIMQASTSKDAPEAEDELWNLLDVIQRKGTKLRDEVEALQGALCNRTDLVGGDPDFHQQILLGNTPEDVINLRRERDILLEKLADMESENLAGRVQASRLRADLESLLAAKIDLEEQLRAAVMQKSELNSRIHDLHLQFVKSAPNSPDSSSGKSASGNQHRGVEKPARRRRTSSQRAADSDVSSASRELVLTNLAAARSPASQALTDSKVNAVDAAAAATTSAASPRPSQSPPAFEYLGRLSALLGYGEQIPKVRVPDRGKIAAILQESDPFVLQRSLLTATVHNQELEHRLEVADNIKTGLIENLSKARDENDDLRFQLEEKNIELEGTRARVRVLERFQLQKSPPSDPTPLTAMDMPPRRLEQLSTPSMKAMTPLPLVDETNGQNSSSTESAHDQRTVETPKRRPSRIPLPGAAAATAAAARSPPSSKGTSTSLPRPGSAQSGCSLSGAKSATSIPGPRTIKTPRDSLTGRLRSNDSLSKLRETSNNSINTPGRSASVCNKRDGLNRVRRINSASRGTILSDTDSAKVNSIASSPKSSLNSEPIEGGSDPLYPDSLDGAESTNLPESMSATSHPTFETANNFLWNTTPEYFDSINSEAAMASTESVQGSGEGLAECDSLEKCQSTNDQSN